MSQTPLSPGATLFSLALCILSPALPVRLYPRNVPCCLRVLHGAYWSPPWMPGKAFLFAFCTMENIPLLPSCLPFVRFEHLPLFLSSPCGGMPQVHRGANLETVVLVLSLQEDNNVSKCGLNNKPRQKQCLRPRKIKNVRNLMLCFW